MGLREEALRALDDLPGHRQAIGSLGLTLRRCKPGSAKHKDAWDRLTKLESEACAMESKIRMALTLMKE